VRKTVCLGQLVHSTPGRASFSLMYCRFLCVDFAHGSLDGQLFRQSDTNFRLAMLLCMVKVFAVGGVLYVQV
jgi:hypothetical protein